MKNYFSGLLCITMLALGLNACKSNNPLAPTSTSKEGMIPLKTGNNWTWSRTQYDENGNIIQTSSIYEEIVKDTVIKEETWYLGSGNHSSVTEPLLTNRNNASFIYYNGKANLIYNTVIEDTTNPIPNHDYLVSKDNPVQISYGKFNCNEYRSYENIGGKNLVMGIDYVELNKGIIKTIQYSYIKGNRFISVITELVSTNAF